MKFPPKSIEEFCEAIEGSGEWKVGVIDGKWRAWIGHDWIEAYVDWVGDELWVNVDRGRYYFHLRRLYMDYPHWSWGRQLEEKGWAKESHIKFVEALEKLW